jgi:predicted nucleic acid-binding protein
VSANIVASSGWLEYLADTDRAHLFAAALEDSDNLVVPVVILYEVFKKVLRERGEDAALQVAGLMQSGRVVSVESSLALEAAHLTLPLADSLIYATAQRHQGTLWTQDEHFKGFQGVRYFAKKPTA